MVRQEQWNIYEAVILLDGFIAIQSKENKRHIIVKHVSDCLRQMAINNGKNIDDIFRNANGISFQMQSMESAYHGYTISKPATKLFTDVVEMYKEDKSKYDTILREAKDMAGVNHTTEDDFIAWLSTKVTSAQLSELYLAYMDVDVFCKGIKILNDSLLKTTDFPTVKKVFQTVEKNKMIKMKYRKNVNKIITAVRYYYNYIKEVSQNKNSDFEKNDIDTYSSNLTNNDALLKINNDKQLEIKYPLIYRKVYDSLKNAFEVRGENGVSVTAIYENTHHIARTETIKEILDNASWSSLNNDGKYVFSDIKQKNESSNYKLNNSEVDDENKFSDTEAKKMLLSAENCIDNEEFDKAYSIYKDLAERGNSEAMYYIGNCYLDGELVEQSDEQALMWFEKAADMNYSDAVNAIGVYYHNAKNLKGKFYKAIEWYKKGAELGNKYSQCNLGWYYEYGLGCTIDLALAEKYYELSAKQGYEDAANYLIRIKKKISKITNFVANHEETNYSVEPEHRDGNALIVNFADNTTYSYTKPIELKYFDDICENIKSWTDLYIRLVSFLYEDYPNVLKTNLTIGNSNRIDIGDYEISTSMVEPKQLKNEQVYIETNYNSRRIISNIRELLNMCNVDYENVEIKYITKNNMEENSLKYNITTKNDTNDRSNIEIRLRKYVQILKENYSKGFRINSNLEIKRFRKYWMETYENEISIDDSMIIDKISRLTIKCGNLAYLPEMMLSDESKEKILNYIKESFNQGNKAIYYDALYNTFKEGFQNERINNSEMLKTYLTYINDGLYVIKRSFIASDYNVEVDAKQEVRNLLINKGMPVNLDVIYEELPHLNKNNIYFAVSGSNSDEFVKNSKGEYFHADIIYFSQDELEWISSIIQNAILEKDYMSGSDLVSTIENKFPDIKEKYPYLTPIGLRDTIKYKLRTMFSFKGQVISSIDKQLSMYEVFANYALTHSEFTLTQLNTLKSELDTIIYFDAIYNNAIRINEEEFVSKDSITFNASEIDSVIGRFCVGGYIALNSIDQFGAFPFVGYLWNKYLLESYVYAFSNKFKLMHACFNAGSANGAIVKKNSLFENFDDLLTDFLAKSTTLLNKEDALQYFCDTGLLARRSCSTIDNILATASIEPFPKK